MYLGYTWYTFHNKTQQKLSMFIFRTIKAQKDTDLYIYVLYTSLYLPEDALIVQNIYIDNFCCFIVKRIPSVSQKQFISAFVMLTHLFQAECAVIFLLPNLARPYLFVSSSSLFIS